MTELVFDDRHANSLLTVRGRGVTRVTLCSVSLRRVSRASWTRCGVFGDLLERQAQGYSGSYRRGARSSSSNLTDACMGTCHGERNTRRNYQFERGPPIASRVARAFMPCSRAALSAPGPAI